MKRLGPALALAIGLAGIAAASETQIVLQWLGPAASPSHVDVAAVEDVLDETNDGDYFIDGHDSGGGTTNIYLYAEDTAVDQAIAHVISLHEQGDIPKGLRVGMAIYSNAARTAWSYAPVYPKGLKSFHVMYPQELQ